jgi:selenide,water dikinase
MRRRAAARVVTEAIAAMLQSAAAASACLAEFGAIACTDVTGFGLLGHLLEMLTASGVDARLDPELIPALDGAMDLLADGVTSSLHTSNLASMAALDDAHPHSPLAALLIDPQTAGGLLAGVPAERAADCLAELRRLGYRAAMIGIVMPASDDKPRVRLEPGCVPALEAPLPAAANS